jgi:hypothetical protein
VNDGPAFHPTLQQPRARHRTVWFDHLYRAVSLDSSLSPNTKLFALWVARRADFLAVDELYVGQVNEGKQIAELFGRRLSGGEIRRHLRRLCGLPAEERRKPEKRCADPGPPYLLIRERGRGRGNANVYVLGPAAVAPIPKSAFPSPVPESFSRVLFPSPFAARQARAKKTRGESPTPGGEPPTSVPPPGAEKGVPVSHPETDSGSASRDDRDDRLQEPAAGRPAGAGPTPAAAGGAPHQVAEAAAVQRGPDTPGDPPPGSDRLAQLRLVGQAVDEGVARRDAQLDGERRRRREEQEAYWAEFATERERRQELHRAEHPSGCAKEWCLACYPIDPLAELDGTVTPPRPRRAPRTTQP